MSIRCLCGRECRHWIGPPAQVTLVGQPITALEGLRCREKETMRRLASMGCDPEEVPQAAHARCRADSGTVTGGSRGRGAPLGRPQDVGAIAAARGLSEADIAAAVKTNVPTGAMDDYIMFSSGGHSGQVLVIGIPPMRLLKVVGPATLLGWIVGAYVAGSGFFRRIDC